MVVLRLPVLWPTIWPLLLLQVSCKTPSCATENERYSDPAVLLPHSHEKTAADCQQRCAENRACQKFSFDKLSLPSGACWLYHNSLAAKMPGISVISGPKVCSEDQKASVQPAASDVLSTKLAHELQHMQEDPEVSKLMNGATSAAPTATTEGTTAPTTERTSGTTSAPTATTEGTTESAETSATTVESTTEATTESPSTTSEEQASTQESDAPEGGLVEACEGGLSTGCPVEWQTGEGGYHCYETQGCRPVIDGPFPLENCQDQCYIGEVEVPGGGNLAVPFDCYADLEYVGKWSPMKQQWCCENSPVASIVCEKGHSSGVEECEDHVGTSCPPEWHTGPTGGYYCSDGPAKGGCRPSSSGAFTLEDCQVQCTIGHCASDSDSTSGPPEPEIWSCGRHLDRREWWPEEKKEYCCQHDEQAKKLCGHFGEAEESPGRPPRCSSEDAAACPDNWVTGHSGGYLCTGQGDPAKGGCRPSSEGPYPVEDCQEQCCIGHTALGGHHPKPEFWDCNRNLGRWKWWPEEKKMYCCKEAKTTPLFCSSYVDRDHVWGHMWRCAHDVGTECPESWRTDSSGGYFCSSGTAAGACRSAADEPFPLEDCQEQCTIGAVSLGGHTPLPDIWDCRAMLTHWESWAEEKKLWCCAHDPEARSVCGHYAAAHSSVSCNANTAGGMDCQFPFQWHGETHNSCYIESNRFGGEPWCIRVDGTWAACDCGPGHGEHTDITHVTHVHPGHYHHSQDHHHYDCENKDTAWSNTKTQWCCAQTEGCNSTGSEPFDCTADLETWEHDWSLQKKSWCWDTDQQVDDDMFDCDKGLENADRGWSADKKDWCCSHKHKGCEQFFNCDLGLENWETAWNATKKKWCWDHEQKGYSKLYNCHDQLANFSEAWTSQKKVWCCANEHLGCGETYDCETGFEQWEILWTTPQKHFCCHTEGKACYDCAAGFANWERGWSAAKKAYCCDKEHKACSSHSCLEVDAMSEWSDEKRQYCCSNHNVACHDCNGDVQAFDAAKEAWCCENEGRCLNSTTTTASPCPDAGFNEDDPDYCNTPIGTWTVEKKAFCCQHFHRGCPGVTYGCDVDSHIWQYAWSLTKKAWCCVHHHVGCYPHYDCDTAVTSWSPEKKVWCCHHEKKGCELYDCYGPPHLWSEPHKDWCCRNHGQGCSEEEPFHCHGGAGQNIYWSPEKKDWCCTHKHIGCSEPHFGGGIHHEHHDHHEHHEHESCSSICHWDGQSHTCKDRIKYAASHRFQNQKHACTAAVHLVAGECDHCGACTVQRSGCYVYWHKELSHHTTSHVVTTVTHLGSSFNCHDGMEDMWAQEKRDFCCWKHRKGCPEPVVPAETYNCDAGFDKWETEWEAVQKEWCCKHRSRACQRFQCDLGLHDFATLWGPPKKVWCCKHEGKGCIAGFQWFDCTEKAEHWERDWTAEKKGWCCSHKKMGCPGWHWHPGGVTHVSHTTYTTHHHSVGGRWVVGWHDGAVHHVHHVIHKSKLHFDCHAALSNWEDAWSPDKKLWCWTNKRLGFSKLFNCKVGEVASWSATKEAWCREHLQIGAPVAAAPAAAAPVQGGTAWGAAGEFVHTGRSHYNCDSALQNWENAWSEGKKTWCWSHLRKGGPEPYSCHDGKAGIWSAPKREWCCDHKKEACPEIARRLSDSESSLYA